MANGVAGSKAICLLKIFHGYPVTKCLGKFIKRVAGLNDIGDPTIRRTAWLNCSGWDRGKIKQAPRQDLGCQQAVIDHDLVDSYIEPAGEQFKCIPLSDQIG